MTRFQSIRRFMSDQAGATAAEFALVLAPLILLTLGSINLAVMVYSGSALHYAAENTARWVAIKATTGAMPIATAVQAHGEGVYRGATTAVTFTSKFSTCGVEVNATADYNFTTGVTSKIMPLTASACYPTGNF